MGGQVALQPAARQPQKAQHQGPARPFLVAGKRRKDRLSLGPLERPRQYRAHEHIGRHQCHLGVGINGAAFNRAAIRQASIQLGLQPRHKGFNCPLHLGQHPLQLGYLEGLVHQPPLLGPLLTVHREDRPADQRLQDPQGVGVLWEGLHLAHHHLAHRRRVIHQQQVQPHQPHRSHGDAEVPFVQQAKPGIQAATDAAQKIRGVGLRRWINRFVRLRRGGGIGHGASNSSIRSKPPLRSGTAVRRYSKCRSNWWLSSLPRLVRPWRWASGISRSSG